MELPAQPLGYLLAVSHGLNLFEALRQHDVPVSCICMAGRRGALYYEVLETGSTARIANPSDGAYVLACMSVLTENRAIEIPVPDEAATHPARVPKLAVAAIKSMTSGIRRLACADRTLCCSRRARTRIYIRRRFLLKRHVSHTGRGWHRSTASG